MKNLFLILTALILLNCTNNAKKNGVAHAPISIPNLFPEAGLTDPHAWVHEGRVYVYCGHDRSWDTDSIWLMDRWEIRSSDNLIDWRKEGEILPTQTYIGDKPNCWAGDIIEHDGKFYWYFSNGHHNTGVAVADKPEGPFKDALGKPLLPKGIISGHPYDPCIFEEDGVYTIIFSSGTYYAATLGEDMISLASEPKKIKIVDKEGKRRWTADKSTLFKYNSKYYLAWGPNYAMSDSLYGTYIYQGKFLAGGHNDVFEWEGQLYAVMENKDIGLFYRGVSLKPIFFNDDGTIKIPADDADFPANGRKWQFEHSRMAWRAVQGTTLEWDEKQKLIKGNISGNAAIESATWLLTELNRHNTLVVRIKNNSSANQAKISVASVNPKGAFWEDYKVNWKEQAHFYLDLKPENDFVEYTINLSENPEIKKMLKKLRIEPALEVEVGSWEIDYISIE